MADLSQMPNLNPDLMTKKDLMKADLPMNTIKEIMELKQIYPEVEDGKSVDAHHLKEELKNVEEEIIKDAEHQRAEKDIYSKKDEYSHKMYDAEK